MTILASIAIGLAIPPVFLLIVQFLVGDPNMLKDAWECRRRCANEIELNGDWSRHSVENVTGEESDD